MGFHSILLPAWMQECNALSVPFGRSCCFHVQRTQCLSLLTLRSGRHRIIMHKSQHRQNNLRKTRWWRCCATSVLSHCHWPCIFARNSALWLHCVLLLGEAQLSLTKYVLIVFLSQSWFQVYSYCVQCRHVSGSLLVCASHLLFHQLWNSFADMICKLWMLHSCFRVCVALRCKESIDCNLQWTGLCLVPMWV